MIVSELMYLLFSQKAKGVRDGLWISLENKDGCSLYYLLNRPSLIQTSKFTLALMVKIVSMILLLPTTVDSRVVKLLDEFPNLTEAPDSLPPSWDIQHNMGAKANLMVDRVQKIHAEVLQHLTAANSKYKAQANIHCCKSSFSPGDLVMVLY